MGKNQRISSLYIVRKKMNNSAVKDTSRNTFNNMPLTTDLNPAPVIGEQVTIQLEQGNVDIPAPPSSNEGYCTII
jgi:hypothetical protein